MHGNRFCGTKGILAAVTAGALTAACAGPVSAELTVADLTGNAVSGVGPFHQDVTDAIKKFGTGDYRGAFKLLESAKQSTPRLAQPEIMMAQMYFDANQIGAGTAMLEQAAQKSPPDPEALVMLGERALADGRVTEAGLLFEKGAVGVERFTENPKRRQNLQGRLYGSWAIVDEATRNWPGAQKKLEELLKLDAQNASAHQRLGRALFNQGDGERAYEQFKTASKADPKLPPPELAMAGLFTDKAKAEQWLNHALSRSGKDARTQVAVGLFRFRNNQLEEAKKHVDEALKLDPRSYEGIALAGLIARLQGDNKSAELHLGAAHLLAPNDWPVTNHLALVLIESPDEATRMRALQFAEYNARQNPDNIDCMASLGWINYKLNRRSQAQRALNAAFTANAAQRDSKMSADMGYYLANLSKDQGRVPMAINLLKEALGTSEPFAYRKSAQELLAQLQKQETTDGDEKATEGAARSAKSGRKPAGGDGGAAP